MLMTHSLSCISHYPL